MHKHEKRPTPFLIRSDQKWAHREKVWRWILPTLIVVGSLLFSRWFWSTLTFPDGDSFYHIKITELLANGIVRDFPWLPFTVLSDTYIDHHFLFHVFLLPFVKFLGPFVGMKIATVLLVAAAALTFYFVLRRLQFRLPFLFTALLFAAPGFIFRLHLAKAPPFSLIFILLGVLFLIKRRSAALAVLSFLYVWAYNLWPILPFIAVVWIVSRSFLFVCIEDGQKKFSRFFRQLVAPEHIRPFIGIVAGSCAGLIINPYFPKNILFSWHHIVQIGVRNFQSQISVGAEWYPTSFLQLLGHNAPLILLFALAIVCFVLEARRRSLAREPIAREQILQTFGLVVLAAVFFVLTVRFRRMIDVFIPFLLLAIAALTTIAWPEVRRGSAWLLMAFAKRYAVLPAVVAVLFVTVMLPVYSTLEHRSILTRRYAPDHFAPAFAWIKDQVPPGALLFHDAWDVFPLLLMRDDRLRYVNGLDPTFFYVRDPERYELWSRMIRGEMAGDVVGIIIERFDSHHVFVSGKHDLFRLQLELSPRARLVYQDETAAVFTLYDEPLP